MKKSVMKSMKAMKKTTTMKSMKAMKKKAVSKIAKGKLAKVVVFKGNKEKTASGHKKSDLMTASAAGGAGLCAVRDHRSELIPSRWNSTRCIDYAVSNLSNINDLQASFAPDRVSDHKILYFRGKLKVSTEVGRLLQPTQDCSKPPGVSQAEWRKALEEEWEAVIPPLHLREEQMRNGSLSTGQPSAVHFELGQGSSIHSTVVPFIGPKARSRSS
jgi:hypothetical protein